MIAWSPVFSGKYDSPWGLLHLWSWLTDVSSLVLLQDVLQVRIPTVAPGSLGYDYVDARWLVGGRASAVAGAERENSEVGRTAILTAISGHGGYSMLGGLADPILKRDRVRYCSRCLRAGYHSIVHQIAGLACCPIHGDRLSDRCPHCAAEMPPFAVSPDASAFLCQHCGACWLGGDVIRPRSDAWRAREEATVGAIVRWIVEVQAHAPGWPKRPADLNANWFRSSRHDDGNGVSYKEALVWAMNEIIAFPLAPSLLKHRPVGLHLCPGAASVQRSGYKRNTNSATKVVTCDRVIALARRHLSVHVLKAHRQCLYDASWVLATARIDGFRLQFDPLLCPVGYAFVWWTLKSSRQLARAYSPSRPLSINQAKRVWSTLLSSFFASVQIAILMRRWAEQHRPEAEYMMKQGVDAWTDPWLGGTMALPAATYVARGVRQQQFALTDDNALATSRCDHGRALRVRLAHGVVARGRVTLPMLSKADEIHHDRHW